MYINQDFYAQQLHDGVTVLGPQSSSKDLLSLDGHSSCAIDGVGLDLLQQLPMSVNVVRMSKACSATLQALPTHIESVSVFDKITKEFCVLIPKHIYALGMGTEIADDAIAALPDNITSINIFKSTSLASIALLENAKYVEHIGICNPQFALEFMQAMPKTIRELGLWFEINDLNIFNEIPANIEKLCLETQPDFPEFYAKLPELCGKFELSFLNSKYLPDYVQTDAALVLFVKRIENNINYLELNKNYRILIGNLCILDCAQLQQTMQYLLHPEVLSEINSNLEHGVKLRKSNALPRSLSVMLNSNRQLTVMVMANNTLANARKFEPGFKRNGRDKIVKGWAFDISDITNGQVPIPHARAAIRLGDPLAPLVPGALKNITKSHKKKRAILQELQAIKKLAGSEYIVNSYLGAMYTHFNIRGSQFSSLYIFSEQAEDCLTNLSSILNRNEQRTKMLDLLAQATPKIYSKLLLDIIKGLKHIHALGYVHRDIKRDNILVYRNSAQQLIAKITDFGATVLESDEEYASATYGYDSPEVVLANEHKNYYFNNKPDTLGKIIYKHSLVKYNAADRAAAQICHQKDDIWALGITSHELFADQDIDLGALSKEYQCTKNASAVINHVSRYNPLIFSMLAEKRADRPNAASLEQSLMQQLSEQSNKRSRPLTFSDEPEINRPITGRQFKSVAVDMPESPTWFSFSPLRNVSCHVDTPLPGFTP